MEQPHPQPNSLHTPYTMNGQTDARLPVDLHDIHELHDLRCRVCGHCAGNWGVKQFRSCIHSSILISTCMSVDIWVVFTSISNIGNIYMYMHKYYWHIDTCIIIMINTFMQAQTQHRFIVVPRKKLHREKKQNHTKN